MTRQFDEAKHPRSDGDGRFTEASKVDPGTGVISGDADANTHPKPEVVDLVSALRSSVEAAKERRIAREIAAVIDATGAPEHEARQAVAETSNPQEAIRHAGQAAKVRMHQTAAKAALEQAKDVEQVITDHGVQAAVTRILMMYPDANHLELTDSDGDGNFVWTVFVGGEDQPLEGSIEDDLWDSMAPVNYRQPHLLAKWCTGYNPGGVYNTLGLEVDRHTSTLDRAIINLDLFRDD